MRTHIIRYFIITVFVLPLAAYSQGGGLNFGKLKKAGEDVLVGFKIAHSNKIAVVLMQKDHQYIVYRFGTADNMELQYPAQLDTTSFGKFWYDGYTRGGGPQNLAMGEYRLKFENAGAEYVMHEDWAYAETTSDDKDDGYTIGIDVTNNGKMTTLQGGPQKTVCGDMGNIMSLEGHVVNHNFDGE